MICPFAAAMAPSPDGWSRWTSCFLVSTPLISGKFKKRPSVWLFRHFFFWIRKGGVKTTIISLNINVNAELKQDVKCLVRFSSVAFHCVARSMSIAPLLLVLIKLNCPYFFTLVWIHLSQTTKATTKDLISTHFQIQSNLKLLFWASIDDKKYESRILLLVFTIKQRGRLETDRLKVKCCHKHWRDLLLVLSSCLLSAGQVVFSTPRMSFSWVMT